MKAIHTDLDHVRNMFPETSATMKHHPELIIMPQVNEFFKIGQDEFPEQLFTHNTARLTSKVISNEENIDKVGRFGE
jgi:hypothetical protein